MYTGYGQIDRHACRQIDRHVYGSLIGLIQLSYFAHTHTRTHARTYTHAHTHTYTHTDTHTRTHTYTHMHTYTHICVLTACEKP